MKVLATRAVADKEAKVIVKNFYAKNEKAKEEDNKLRDLLLLPASETIIDCMFLFLFLILFRCNLTFIVAYVCTYDGKTGKIILTSNYLCFDPLMGGGPDSDHQLALKFTELKEIQKVIKLFIFWLYWCYCF